MRELLDFILKNIIDSKNFEILETEDNGRMIFMIKLDPQSMGLIIGKKGKTIRAIRNVLKVRGTLEKKLVSVDIQEMG